MGRRLGAQGRQDHPSDGARARPADQPFAVDYRTVGELYHKILAGIQSIPQETLFIGPQQAQSNARYLDFASKLVSVVDADSARRAIEMIIEQGEAPSRDHPDAHFAVFDTIRKGFRSATDEAAKNGTVFAPVRPVISNPMTRFYEDASGGNVISDPLTHEVADLFNLVYDTMLLMLVRFFAHLDEGDEELRMLSRGTLRMMASVLRPLGEALATMPAGPEYPGMTAGPGFGYNRDVTLLPHKTSAWVFILERLRELVSKAKTIARSDPHAREATHGRRQVRRPQRLRREMAVQTPAHRCTPLRGQPGAQSPRHRERPRQSPAYTPVST